MDWSLITNALGLVVQLSVPVIAAALAGALIVGVLQAATQIQDEAIGFAGRFFAVLLLIYVAGSQLSDGVVEFTQRVWSGADVYR